MSRRFVSDRLGYALEGKLPKPIAKLVKPILFSILGISNIDRIYNGACNLKSDDNFAEKLLHKDVMNIGLDISDIDIAKIPKEGPLVIVSNHPFGAIDGISLLALLKRVRPDVKLMANYVLGGIPELREHFFLVDPFGNADSSQKSFGGVRETVKWLKDGHVLGVFPAGEVAAYDKKLKKVVDKEWGKATGMVIRTAKCPVQPIFFKGSNSKFFQFLGKIKPVLRTLWLARECNRSCNKDITIKVGETISAEKCRSFKKTDELMLFLREKAYELDAN